MSRKLNSIPYIKDYSWIRNEMDYDLQYRLKERVARTSFGVPLYYNINVQVVVTQECPFNCPFCHEKKNPMSSEEQDFDRQISSLKKVLKEHPTARLTITGGEPTLYLQHVENLVKEYRKKSENLFVSINTAGYDNRVCDIAGVTVNLSHNDFVKPNLSLFSKYTYQTVLSDKDMTLENISKIMKSVNTDRFSFRFLTSFDKKEYSVGIWNAIESSKDFQVKAFRIGDFFTYCTFNHKGKSGRVTLGDMFQQKANAYGDGYSNIIIHPDGKIDTNWK